MASYISYSNTNDLIEMPPNYRTQENDNTIIDRLNRIIALLRLQIQLTTILDTIQNLR